MNSLALARPPIKGGERMLVFVFSTGLGQRDLKVALLFFVSFKACDSCLVNLSLQKGEFQTLVFILSQCFSLPKAKLLAAKSIRECLILCLSILPLTLYTHSRYILFYIRSLMPLRACLTSIALSFLYSRACPEPPTLLDIPQN